MTEGIKTIIFPVRDLARAKALYSVLAGVKPDLDKPYYVGLDVDGARMSAWIPMAIARG